MKNIILILFLLFYQISFAQLKTYTGKGVVDDIKRADSVIILSHLNSNVAYFKDGKIIDSIDTRVIIKQKLNTFIVQEKQLLNQKAKKELIKIINTAKYKPPRGKPREIEKAGCYNPHHSVLIYMNGEIFHWEICFGCRGMSSNTHDYYKKIDELFDNKKYTLLQEFFKKQGMKYELYR
ncbi:MAG: hypothetical protein MUC49_03730 [Raineya sp.]|jgi:hypothetical protein|nr:hypothetical protein [Raineya sp.]